MRVELLPAILGTPFNPLSMLPMVELVGTLVHSSVLMKDVDLDRFDPDEVPFDLVLLVRPAESAEAVKSIFDGVKNVAIQYFPLSLGGQPAPAPAPEPGRGARTAARPWRRAGPGRRPQPRRRERPAARPNGPPTRTRTSPRTPSG